MIGIPLGLLMGPSALQLAHDSLDELPAQARALLDRIGELVGVPVGLVSVGPQRDQTIELSDPFAG